MKTKLTQRDFLEQKFAENFIELNISSEKSGEYLAAFEEIKEKLDTIFYNITNYEYVSCDENIFPYWTKLRKDEIEFEKDGEGYIRRYDDYKYCVDNCIDAISIYIKSPMLHCDELSNLLLTLYFILEKRYIFNYLGFKCMPWINGWRYNFWGYITGNYTYSLILGSLTSGFILFPLLAYIILAVNNHDTAEIIALCLGFLFAYKVIKFAVLWLLSLFNIRSSRSKKLLNLLRCYDYVTMNDIIQPSKLKQLSSSIDYLPAPVSILISKIQNNDDILGGFNNFILLYQDKNKD